MTNIYGWVAATIVLGFFLKCAIRPSLIDIAGRSVPPGPLLRYAFLRKYSERALDAWAKHYGPLYSLWMGNQLFIIISDAHVAKEFFYTHGAIFSSRKNYFIKNQTILNGRAITASPYGQTWRDHRKIAMQVLNTNAVSDRSPLMEFEAWDLVHGIFMATKGGTTPVDPVHLIGKYALNNMLSVTFGFRAGLEDPLVEQALAIAMEFMELTGVLANAVDFVPILQYIPTRTHSRAKKVHDELVRVYGAMILRVKEQMASAPADVPDCLVKRLLEENMIKGHVIQGKAEEKEGELDWEDACMVSAAFTLGGLHSTAGIIMWFLSLIPSHPEVQARAQEELDRVVGSERWSIPDEERNLPYVRAVAKELERMHAPFWVPTAHYSTADFVYQGMYIPKGTAVVLNNYTIHHNDKRYPDPHTFNPDRYLGDDLTCAESARLPALERDHWTFGAGRRLCPGISIAEKEIWLAISRILWAFTVEPVPEEPISLEEYEGEFGRSPLPFRVRFLPREGLESAFEDRKD